MVEKVVRSVPAGHSRIARPGERGPRLNAGFRSAVRSPLALLMERWGMSTNELHARSGAYPAGIDWARRAVRGIPQKALRWIGQEHPEVDLGWLVREHHQAMTFWKQDVGGMGAGAYPIALARWREEVDRHIPR